MLVIPNMILSMRWYFGSFVPRSVLIPIWDNQQYAIHIRVSHFFEIVPYSVLILYIEY